MLKNFVIIQHFNSSHELYLFLVPRKISLEAGDKIVCDTSRGPNQLGVCCCDSFMSKPEIMCPLFSTTPDKLRYVTGKIEYDMFEEAREEEENDEDG